MKRISFIWLLVAVLFAGCKEEVEEVEQVLSFDITNKKDFTIPKEAVNPDIPKEFTSFPVTGVASSAEADFQRNNTTTNLVKNIRVRELILTMPDQSAGDFSFLQTLDVYIAMPDGTQPTLLAYNRDIKPTVGKMLVFTPTETEMDKYVKAGDYMLFLKNAKVVHTVSNDMPVTASLTFSVTASPLQ